MNSYIMLHRLLFVLDYILQYHWWRLGECVFDWLLSITCRPSPVDVLRKNVSAPVREEHTYRYNIPVIYLDIIRLVLVL